LPDETPLATKAAWLKQLQTENEAYGKSISQAMLGTVQRVLIDGPSWKSPELLAGKTDNGRVVDIAADKGFIHQFVNVKITDVSNPHRLVGEIVSA
jgi:tRNA-2-methylthio-N6-dimethylallyladenosine synthase